MRRAEIRRLGFAPQPHSRASEHGHGAAQPQQLSLRRMLDKHGGAVDHSRQDLELSP